MVHRWRCSPLTATTMSARNCKERGRQREEALKEAIGRFGVKSKREIKTIAACYGNFPPSQKYFLHVFSRVIYPSASLFLALSPTPSYPPSITPLQTVLSLWGALSFPLGQPGSFQGTLMDANAGLFQIVLQPEPLICQQASLHGLPVLRKCKSPPYRHL